MLVIEDEILIGMLLEDLLTDMGITVLEVAATLSRGLALASDIEADGAILDVNIGGKMVFPVADALATRGIPFVFATGYGAYGLSPRYARHNVIAKPFDPEPLQQFLLAAFV
ncbi:MAG TPA: response regulator [Rhodopila sp.]